MLIDLQLSKFGCQSICNTTYSLVVKNSFIHVIKAKHYWGESRHSTVSFSVYLYTRVCVCTRTYMCIRVCIYRSQNNISEGVRHTNRKNCIQIYRKLQFLLLLSAAVTHYGCQIRERLGIPSQAKIKPHGTSAQQNKVYRDTGHKRIKLENYISSDILKG